MGSRLAAFVIWAALAASAVFWALRLLPRPAAPPAHAVLVPSSAALAGDLSRVLGADPDADSEPGDDEQPAPAADSRFRLIGVVAPRSSAPRAAGVALIAFDDKPPKAYRVGATVDGDLVLQSVHARGAVLGPRGQPPQVALELPALPPPSVGVPSGAVPGATPALRQPLQGRFGVQAPMRAPPPAAGVPPPAAGMPPAAVIPQSDDEDPPPAPAPAPRRPPV